MSSRSQSRPLACALAMLMLLQAHAPIAGAQDDAAVEILHPLPRSVVFFLCLAACGSLPLALSLQLSRPVRPPSRGDVCIHKQVRRQSVEIEVRMSGVLVPEQGYGVILVDGSLIAQVRVPHQSIIVADDATLGEGVRIITAYIVAPDGMTRLGAEQRVEFQFARNFQASLFGEPELFIVHPREGQLLRHAGTHGAPAGISEAPVSQPTVALVRVHNPPETWEMVLSVDGGDVCLYMHVYIVPYIHAS